MKALRMVQQDKNGIIKGIREFEYGETSSGYLNRNICQNIMDLLQNKDPSDLIILDLVDIKK